MVDITKGEFEELVGENAGSIGKAEQGMVREDGPDAHGASMECCFPTEAAQRGVAVYNVDLLSYDDVPEYGKEGEDSRHSGRAVYRPEGHVVAFQTIREVSNPSPIFVGVSDDHHLVTSIDEPLG